MNERALLDASEKLTLLEGLCMGFCEDASSFKSLDIESFFGGLHQTISSIDEDVRSAYDVFNEGLKVIAQKKSSEVSKPEPE